MKQKWRKTISCLLAGILLFTGVVWPEDVKAEENTVTVISATELENALASGNTQIIISGEITVGDTADDSGKMIPLEIPANVTLQGENSDAVLYCRCPMQITGDNVTIRDLQMKFLSSNALGSVAHREIFLAGHSLTLDNVNTYQEGNAGSLGGLGGTEEELLPTVYAGGFEGTTVSDNAILTIQNSNEYSVFQAIYMGHAPGEDSKEPYTGETTLSIGAKTKVRDGIYVNQNDTAEIYVSGEEYSNLSSVAFYGNKNTKLQIDKVSVNRAEINQVGNVIIQDNGYLQLDAGNLNDVTVQGGACLDLNKMTEVAVTGNFTGGTYDEKTDTRGVLVLNKEGSLQIGGNVIGSTLFHTENRYFPGTYTDAHIYIAVADEKADASAFVLPEEEQEYYELDFNAGKWTAFELNTGDYVLPQVGAVEILSSPKSVDVSKIVSENYIPASQAPYCNVVWKDENGTAYTTDEVCENAFYAGDMVIAIRTDYWESDLYSDKEDWGVPVWFEMKKDNPDYCYFYTEKNSEIKSGKYTYLFCDTYFDALGNVADVKTQLEGNVKAQCEVVFFDSTKGETPSSVVDTESEDDIEEPKDEPQEPVHTHTEKKQVVQASPGKDGLIKTVCNACGEVLASEVIAAPKTMILSKRIYSYSGKLCKPKVTIKDTKGGVIDSGNYTVTYAKNKKVGTASVIVSFKGNYTGTMKKTFTIRPKQTKITKITSSKKKIVVKWKKVSAQIDGYEIQYSTSKKFTKKTTKKMSVNKRKTKVTIKKPKPGKKYYVRIRTYKKVKVNGKTKKLYSSWSKVKKA